MMGRSHGAPVKVVVIGDEGAGKTSLITSAATESFPDHPPPVLPHTRLPPEATPEHVPMIIMDTSSLEEERAGLEAACMAADVALLVFAADSLEALRRVQSYWMLELRRLGFKAPVILVGCKSDLTRDSSWDLQQEVVEVMNTFREIETCLECSAKNLVFVAEVFYYAVKAVMHPSAPLFDSMTQTLKPRCVSALKRIFMLCDSDQSDALDDDELNAFQTRCFNAPLQPEELLGIKKVVEDKLPTGWDETGLTLSGFLFLHALFIERGRLETTWAVLRKFGYGESLRISDDVLDEVSFARGPDQVVEFSHNSRGFLGQRFRHFADELSGVLSPANLEEVFNTAPYSLWTEEQYQKLLVRTASDGLTEEGWMAKWAFTAAVDPRAALEWLLYLGYDKQPASAFQISRPRRAERRAAAGASATSAATPVRSVLQGLVLGSAGAGKTTLLARLAGEEGSDPAASVQPGVCCAAGHVAVDAEGNSIEIQLYQETSRQESPRDSKQAVLLLREVSEQGAEDLLRDPDGLAARDVAVFVFDCTSLSSWETAHSQMLSVAQAAGNVLPCVMVAAKDDLGMSDDVSSHCSAALAEVRLPPPIPLGLPAGSEPLALWSTVVAAAQQDYAAHIPQTPSLKAAQKRKRLLRRVALYTAAVFAVSASIYGGWLLWHHNSGSDGNADNSSSSSSSIGDHHSGNVDVQQDLRQVQQ